MTTPALPVMTPEDMRLRLYPDTVLTQDGVAITVFDDDLRRNVTRMKKLMYEYRGIGLAAHQVGWPVQLFVVGMPLDVPDQEASSFEEVEESIQPETQYDEFVLINPSFVSMSKQQSDFEEGCLSFPDIRAKIRRPEAVEITAYDEHGIKFSLEAEGLLSRCLQHEYDHIRGQLYNRLWSPATQTRLQGRIRELVQKEKDEG